VSEIVRVSASTLKLIGNGNLAAALELLAETLTLGEKSGIGQQTVYDLITGEPWTAFCRAMTGS